jgi:uncharacterized protein DUF2188
MAKKKPVHVVYRAATKQWAVEREGSKRASSLHDKQKQAEQQGRKTAKNNRTELIIHSQQGQIRARDSYGSDPRSSKG